VGEREVGGTRDIPKLSSQVGRVTRAPESPNPSIQLYSVRRRSSSCTWLTSAYVSWVRLGLASAGPRSRRASSDFAAEKTFAEVSRPDIHSVPALQRWTSACPHTSDIQGVVRLS